MRDPLVHIIVRYQLEGLGDLQARLAHIAHSVLTQPFSPCRSACSFLHSSTMILRLGALNLVLLNNLGLAAISATKSSPK
jgi:hypothetical protein